jgi:uncharacterized protein DUF4386
MTSPRTLARIAGSLYLGTSVVYVLAMQVRARVIQPGDASATADNIRSAAALFRVALVADLVSGAGFLLLALVLYLLLKDVNEFAALTMVTFVAVMTAVGYLNELNQYSALTVATSPKYTTAFGHAGSNALVMLFTDIRSNGLDIQELLFGLWLFPLAYLVIKSAYVPKVLGVLLIIAAVGWVAEFFAIFLIPHLPGFAKFSGLGELIFAAWLLVKAVRVPALEAPAPNVGPPMAAGARESSV